MGSMPMSELLSRHRAAPEAPIPSPSLAGRGDSAAQLEAAEVFYRRVFDADVFDLRVRGTPPHPLDHPLDAILFAAEMRLDRPVGAIADPSADSELARLALRPCAEEHALHPAGHPNVL